MKKKKKKSFDLLNALYLYINLYNYMEIIFNF